MFCQQWSYFRYDKEEVEVSNQKYKRPMEIWILCESEVICSAHWWSSLEITSWSRSDHFCEPVILQKIVSSMESISLTFIHITLLQFCHSWHLDIAEFWGGSETAITLTMQRKENLIQCGDIVFIYLNRSCFFAGAIGWANLAKEIEPAFD